jgi:hypothetical protein
MKNKFHSAPKILFENFSLHVQSHQSSPISRFVKADAARLLWPGVLGARVKQRRGFDLALAAVVLDVAGLGDALEQLRVGLKFKRAVGVLLALLQEYRDADPGIAVNTI